MRTLFLVRHAKAIPEADSGLDRDRPLEPEGEEQARQLGKRLRKTKPKVELILSSPAVRAFGTAGILIEAGVGGKRCQLKTDHRIYMASADQLCSVIESTDRNIKALLLVGHNPGISDLAEMLSEQAHALPTTGLAAFELDMKSWAKLRKAKIARAAIRIPD